MPTLDSLLVQIDASTELLRRELQKGGTAVDSFARNTERQVGGVGASFGKMQSQIRSVLSTFGVGFGVAAVVSFTKGAIQAADAIGEMARAAGFGAERFQRLQFVFKQNGVNAGEFESAMRTLNTRLGQFITTGAGPAAKAIEQLGLKQRIASGEIRTSEQLFDAVVEALGRVDNAAQHAALNAAFFGREVGSKMAPTMQKGTDALNEAAAAATGVFSDETVRQADKLADAMGRLGSATWNWVKGLAISATYVGGQSLGIKGLQPDLEEQIKLLEERQRLMKAFGNQSLTPAEQARLDDLRKEQANVGRYRTGGRFGVGIPDETGPAPPDDGLSEASTSYGRLPAGMKHFDFAGAAAEALNSQLQEVHVTLTEMPKELKKFDFAGAIKGVEDFQRGLQRAQEKQRDMANFIGGALQNTLADAFMGAEVNFKGLLKRMAAELLASGLTKSIMGLFAGKGGGAAGSFLSKMFGFAEGGRPPMGRASLVGERGPELWIPDVPGRILSAGQTRAALAGGGSTINVYNENHIATGVAPNIDAQLSMYGHAIARKTYDAVMARLGGHR